MPEADLVLDRLPHTGLARIPDAIVELEPGVRVVARLRLLPTDARLNPDGRLPAVLLVELMAQAGGLLLEPAHGADGTPTGSPPALPSASSATSAAGSPVLLAGVRRMHLHDTPRAGETVLATCRLIRRLGKVLLIEGRAEARAEAQPATARPLAHGTLQLSLTGGRP